MNKPGQAQVGAISKAQKQQKDFKVSKCFLLQHMHEEKNEKKIRIFSNFLKNFFVFSGKSHSAEKCKRGPQKYLINLKCQ